MERTKDEYKYFIVKISFKNSHLTGKLVFLANSFGERTVSVIRSELSSKHFKKKGLKTNFDRTNGVGKNESWKAK